MMNKLCKAGFVGLVAITLTAAATASGPKWTETGDAGSLPKGSQTTMGIGTLAAINGTMGTTALLGGVDFEDMFLINIVEPMKFRATTDPKDPELLGGEASFDTMVWIFRPTPGDPPEVLGSAVLGFLGNDNHPDVPESILSLLIPLPTDGSPPLVDAGLYFIAISRFNNVPNNPGGEIFFFDPMMPTEISGPDGAGGKMPISGWTGDNGGQFEGTYRIALRGVEFAEELPSCPWDLDGSGDVGVSDFLELLGGWGPCPPFGDCPADFDGSGDVGVADFLKLLGNWGPCP